MPHTARPDFLDDEFGEALKAILNTWDRVVPLLSQVYGEPESVGDRTYYLPASLLPTQDEREAMRDEYDRMYRAHKARTVRNLRERYGYDRRYRLGNEADALADEYINAISHMKAIKHISRMARFRDAYPHLQE
jgi:hypothetical protein